MLFALLETGVFAHSTLHASKSCRPANIKPSETVDGAQYVCPAGNACRAACAPPACRCSLLLGTGRLRPQATPSLWALGLLHAAVQLALLQAALLDLARQAVGQVVANGGGRLAGSCCVLFAALRATWQRSPGSLCTRS